VGATASGRIARDRLFFFAAFNPQWQRQVFIAPQNRDSAGNFVFPLAALGEVARNRRIYSYAGKLTWQMGSNHHLDFSAFGDPAKGPLGPQRVAALVRTDTAGFSELRTYGGHNQVLKYDGILSRNWLLEALAARASNRIEEVPSVNQYSLRDTTVVPNVRTGGIGFFEQGNRGTNMQYQVKSTNLFRAAGNHQVRYGVLMEDIDYDQVNQYTGPTFTLPDGRQTATGALISVLPDPTFGRIFRVTRANLQTARNTTQRYWSAFLQDTWEIGDRLTFRPGIRWERQTLVGTLTDFTFDNNWGPRIGATYDVLGNGKSKIFASWGRFFAKIPNDLAARAFSADAGVTRADYFDASLTRPVPAGTLAAGTTQHLLLAGLNPSQMDPKSRSTYQDEILAGLEWQVLSTMSVGARYIHRSMPRILEDVGTAAVLQYFTIPEQLASVEYFITNPREGYPAVLNGVAAFESPEHRYDSVELTAQRTFSDNWALFASYRWSKLRGNFEGFYRNDNGQSDPAITSLYDFPTNDPTYSSPAARALGFRGDIRYLGCTLGCGELPNDRRHQAKIYGSRAFGPLGIGIGFNAASGAPLTALAAHPFYENGGEIPEGVRGSGMETVDGFRTRTSFETTVDLHADYALGVGGRRLVLLADAFNLLNRQRPTFYDNWTEITFGVPNPNFGQPADIGGGLQTSFHTPRQIRLGARFEW
jgi:hypothetical protein